MQATIVYAIVIGGILFLFLARQLLLILERCARSPSIRAWVFRHLEVAVVEPQRLAPSLRRLAPALSRLDLLLQSVYWCGTATCNVLGVHSISQASRRAGTLTTINMIPLFFGDRLAFTADLLDLSRRTYRQLHRSVGIMATAQMALHMVLQAIDKKINIANLRDKFGLIVRSTPTSSLSRFTEND